MLRHHLPYVRTFFICSMILTLGLLVGCDRFKDKWERRERKIRYLNEEIDSARNIQARYQDSLRHVHDSIREHQK